MRAAIPEEDFRARFPIPPSLFQHELRPPTANSVGPIWYSVLRIWYSVVADFPAAYVGRNVPADLLFDGYLSKEPAEPFRSHAESRRADPRFP